jgi:N-acetylglucosaminyldiphosphoundecaprenol N-acetyl-beta-D-mannosaminyltransferase
MTEYKILGVKVQTLDEQTAKATLQNFLNSDKTHQVVTVNPEFIVKAQHHKKFREIINQADLATIDGTGIIKALQWLGHNVSLEQRLTGVELTKLLLILAEQQQKKILFCLQSSGLTTAEELTTKIKNDYPQLNFCLAEEKNVLAKIASFSPVIILLGLGAPRQDIWIADHLNSLPSVKIAVGVGGTFDFLSGKIKRAPKFMRSFGLEWLWRFIRQPQRFKRIIRATIVFPLLVLKDKVIKKYEN